MLQNQRPYRYQCYPVKVVLSVWVLYKNNTSVKKKKLKVWEKQVFFSSKKVNIRLIKIYSFFLVQKTPLIEHSCSVLVCYLDYFNCVIFYKHCFTKIYYVNLMFKLNDYRAKLVL